MPEDLIRYDILAQDALRGVVRKVLSEVSRTGLPGDHHFFISFASTAPGVRVSTRLLNQYPEEMTIILQHQYWDLTVTEHAFEVGLSFDGVPERLLVPFTALRGFLDPSVQFGLQFTIATPTGKAVTDDKTAGEQPPLAVARPATETDGNAQAREDGYGAEKSGEAAHVVSLDAFRKK